MKYNIIKVITLSGTLLLTALSGNTQEKTLDRCESPYFQIIGDEKGTETLPLNSTKAEVSIAGVIANVTVKQQYQNRGNTAIEAIYVFPASTRAAVHAMKMKIGERTIEAVVKEKEQARKDYEQAVEEGKTASLLEQHRPNVFQMNVGNIMPGDIIDVTLSYTELLVPEDGIYSFVYPTVVGPRYTNGLESDADKNWVSNPYTNEGEAPTYTFDIDINLNTGVPLSDLKCETHKTDITYQGVNKANIKLTGDDSKAGNKDFVCQYKLKGDKIESGLLLYEGEEENFFLSIIQPPKAITYYDIPPREYVFIVDISGSMFGFPLDISKTLMSKLLSSLKPNDKFNILLFAGGSQLFKEQSVYASQENIAEGISFIESQRGGGGTELISALEKALALKGTEDYSRSFVILTDGYVAVEKEAFELINKNLDKANFFAFGIGSSVNRYIIEGIARTGKAEAFVALNKNEATKVSEKFRKYIENPVLTNIKVNFEGFDAYDIEPLSVPDVFAERPVIVFGKYKGNAKGKIVLQGLSGNNFYKSELDVNDYEPAKNNEALKYLWARERISMLDDFDKFGHSNENKPVVTELGLKYNLLTAYTSFVAIDSEVRNTSGKTTTVSQPLPLPEGVSNYALKSMAVGAASRSVQKMHAVEEFEIVEDEMALEYAEFEKESKSSYKGGQNKFEDYILTELKKKIKDYSAYIGKKIEFSFDLDTNGNIRNIKIVSGINTVFDKALIDIIKTSKNWIPGDKNETISLTIMLK